MNRVEVLDKVGGLLLLPNTELSTTKQVAEFYGIEANLVHSTLAENREEILNSGVERIDYHEIKKDYLNSGGKKKNWKEYCGEYGITYNSNIHPKKAILVIGFLLDDSPKAEEVRRLVMGDYDDLFEPVEEEYAYQMYEVIEPVIVEPTVQKKHNNIQSDELIKTQVNINNEIIVSGRELYEFLEVNTPFHKWIARMIEYGFAENQDYMVMDIFVPNSKGGKQNQIEYALKLDMAKEISMIQRNEKGKQARQYFIETEKKYKEAQSQLVASVTPSYVIDNPIERAKQWIAEQQEKMLLETTVQEQVGVIEYKQEVIESLTEKVSIAEKRQFLNKVVRSGCYNPNAIQEKPLDESS